MRSRGEPPEVLTFSITAVPRPLISCTAPAKFARPSARTLSTASEMSSGTLMKMMSALRRPIAARSESPSANSSLSMPAPCMISEMK